ncbi:MAG: LptA/OstA family protein [Chthoniobacterales bacterium]
MNLLRLPTLVASLWIGVTAASFAQSTPTSPTMSPNSGGSKKADPSGLGLLQKDRPKGAKTEITAEDSATFDNDKNLAVFTGKVVVVDPQFKLFCEQLNVFLNAERKGLDRAEAEGNVVIIQENVDDKGDVVKSIGRAGKAVFNPTTGDITMTVSPQIQQGINNHIAATPETVMILNRQGRLTTNGKSRTTIVDATDAP